ncbi:eIF-2-alpha kinase activator Gcn1p [[Candida] anglica]|uniref:EIF-2-alpha kinase activator Gcn1p n=1 Tax=[Candida] anglica TaxID=148631 RepID=A0ABP0E8P5_9ASCO
MSQGEDISTMSWDQLGPILEKNVNSSLTSVRIPTIGRLIDLVTQSEIPLEAYSKISVVTLSTYNYYSDDDSRKQALRALETLLDSKIELLPKYVKYMLDIASNTNSMSVTGMITLLSWTNSFSVIASKHEQFESVASDLIVTQAYLLDKIVSYSKCGEDRSKHRLRVYDSVLSTTKSAIAKTLLSTTKITDVEIINIYTDVLTTKITNTNASLSLLGVLSKCLEDLIPVKPSLNKHFQETQTDKVLDYFGVQVLLGKGQTFTYSLEVFGHFVHEHISLAKFTEKILPSLEKANLRSPESTFGSILPTFFAHLDVKDCNLATTFSSSKLLSQIISAFKSTKDITREGAFSTSKVLIVHLNNNGSIEPSSTVVTELFKALKSVSNADQKLLFANTLALIRLDVTITESILTQLLPYVSKDQNETSLVGFVSAFVSHYLRLVSSGNSSIDAKIKQQIITGLGDKKLNLRRIWSTVLGDELIVGGEGFSIVSEEIYPALLKSLSEVQASPLPAITGKGIASAYVAIALRNASPSFYFASDSDKAILVNALQTSTDKPAILTNYRVYTKLVTEADQVWFLRALQAALSEVNEESTLEYSKAWLYFATSTNANSTVRRLALQLIGESYQKLPSFSTGLISGIYDILRTYEQDSSKEDPFKYKLALLSPVISSITTASDVLSENVRSLLIACNHASVPVKNGWTGLCQRAGLDVGQLVQEHADSIVSEALNESASSAIYAACIKSLALAAFIQPDIISPKISEIIGQDVQESNLKYDSTHIDIWRAAEGELVVNVLDDGKKRQEDKNSRDYETRKWEEDMRKELASKGKAVQKKLTREEQLLVKEQLEKESTIRSEVQATVDNFTRAIDVVNELVNDAAKGVDNGAKHWFPVAVNGMLSTSSNSIGVSLLGDAAAKQFIHLSELLTDRLGTMKTFIGVAVLRVHKIAGLSENYFEEPILNLLSRILFRVKFLSDHKALDSLSLSYLLPLLNKVLENGKAVAIRNASKQAVTSEFVEEDAEEEQLLLAMEILAAHAEAFEDEFIPRTHILKELISLMKLPTRAKLAKECFLSISSNIAVSISDSDLQVLLDTVISPELYVRTAVLESLDAEFDLSDMSYSNELWIAVHDNDPQCSEFAASIWSESGFEIPADVVTQLLPFFNNQDTGLRLSIANAVFSAVSKLTKNDTIVLDDIVQELIAHYWVKEQPPAPLVDQFGLIVKTSQEQKDTWEDRSTVALALKTLSPLYKDSTVLALFEFLVQDPSALGDKEDLVRQELQDAGVEIIQAYGASNIAALIPLFEECLSAKDTGSRTQDKIRQSVIILYGALARHLDASDPRLNLIVERLLKTLDTPSEDVQYSVSECIAPLVPKFQSKLQTYFDELFEKLFDGKKMAIRRGAAYGLAGLVKGAGIKSLSTFDIIRSLTDAADDKKNSQRREGVSYAFECLSQSLGKFFEPYVIEVLPIILKSLGDQVPEVREATDLAARQIMKNTTSFGVKQLIPVAIANLDEIQWRSKKGSVELLGSMAYLDPTQLSASLSTIVPEIVGVLNDTHKEVRKAADQALKRFGEVIRNPEIQGVVPDLLNAIGDPTKYTDAALDKLIKTQFVHYIDGPSLALIIHVIHRGMRDRSAATKRKACQIVGNMAFLVDAKDLNPYLNELVAELEVAMVDPVPGTRSTAARALGSLVEKLGEDQFPDLIPRLLDTLQDESRAGDRLGSAQALAEVVCGLGISKLEELLPSILSNAASPRNHIRAGYMPLLLFLPVCFGSQFSPYLARIIPPILNGLADVDEDIRDTALRAGRLIVKNYATKAVDLLLPELELGLSDTSYRIRLSSVELTGDLLFQVTGITGKNELSSEEAKEGEEDEEVEQMQSSEINKALIEALGQERRDRILALLFICRSDTAGIVRNASVDIWKALVANTPRTIKEILPTLTHFIVRRLASPETTQRTIAAQTLGEMVRRVGANALAQLLPTLEEALISSDTDSKQGICIALTELIKSSQHDALVEYQDIFIRTIREALTDPASGVREAAASAFEALQEELGKVVIDEILPHLLNLLQSEGSESENALLALRDIMSAKSDIIFPILLPTLLSPPIDAFKAGALASLASVAGPALYKRLSHVINTLVQAIMDAKNQPEEQQQQIKDAFDSVLLAIDAGEGLHPLMQQLMSLVKHEDSARRATVYARLGNFFTNTSLDYSVYTQDMVSQFILSLGDKSPEVVQGTFDALSALVKQQPKESLERLVKPARQALGLTGVLGEDLAGFTLARGPSCVLPIFLHGLMYGNSEQKELSAQGIAEVIEKTPAANLKPFATTVTGPLIRVIGEKVSSDIKAAILHALTVLLAKIPQFLRPFIPQLQRTFVRSLSDQQNEGLRSRAVVALGTLIEFQPRVDSLVTELVSGAKVATEQGVKTSILKGILEVVSKAGKNMSEGSKTSIMTLVEEEITKVNDKSAVAYARLVGSLSKILSSEEASNIIKSKILSSEDAKFAVLSINSFLRDAPLHIFETGVLPEITDFIVESASSADPYISDNATVAIGKLLLLKDQTKSPVVRNPVVSETPFNIPESLIEKLMNQLSQNMLQPVSNSPDSRRLALVVVRTVARFQYESETKPFLDMLAPSVFTCIRDPIIPIRLAAEKAFLAIFNMIDDVALTDFNAWFEGKSSFTNAIGATIQPRSIGDYTKRVGSRLASVERERIEAGGDAETMFSDRFEDETEVWAVGGVDKKK